MPLMSQTLLKVLSITSINKTLHQKTTSLAFILLTPSNMKTTMRTTVTSTPSPNSTKKSKPTNRTPLKFLQKKFLLQVESPFVILYFYPLLVFYIPKCKGFKRLKCLIEQYGGIVINIIECCSFQVCPSDCDENLEEFFRKGLVFKEDWIIECIAS